MDEKSTLGICNEEIMVEEVTSQRKPSSETLEFLRMFARSYNAHEESLQTEKRSLCLN